jgi:hypothetical protein
VIAGNSQSHLVKLVDAATKADVPGGSATVNTAGAQAGTFAYAALAPPVTLMANHSYYLLSQEFAGGDLHYDYTTTVTPTSLVKSIDHGEKYVNGTWQGLGSVGNDIGPVDLIDDPPTDETATKEMTSVGIPGPSTSMTATSLSAARLSALQNAQLVIAQLPNDMLADTVGNTITIDPNADEYGWYVIRSGKVPYNQVDSLTVEAHRLGYVLGLPDILIQQAHPGDRMDNTLPPGVRQLSIPWFDVLGFDAGFLESLTDSPLICRVRRHS